MPKICNPRDVALKSLFLGPQAENAEWLRQSFDGILNHWFAWRRSRFPSDGCAISDEDRSMPEFDERQQRFALGVAELQKAFEAELPKFSPRYFGHMFSETSLPALAGHFITLLHNPNNISGESSRVGTRIETEAIASLAKMVGYPESAPGHFTAGGTIANFEAMLRARERLLRSLSAALDESAAASSRPELFLECHREYHQADATLAPEVDSNPFRLATRVREVFDHEFEGPVVLAPEHAHYSWAKACHALGLGKDALWPIALDSKGRLSVEDLERRIHQARAERRPVLMVVSVCGTTELGSIDPIHRVSDCLEKLRALHGIHIWHHVDAAFGGFFGTFLGDADCESTLGSDSITALQALRSANSVTLDPHKLGYVPYSCGAFICREILDYRLTAHGAAYVQFDPAKDRGQTTLEGSRSATGASATWLAARAIGLDGEGYGRILRRTMRGLDRLRNELSNLSPRIELVPAGDTNILCFLMRRPGDRLSDANRRTLAAFERFGPNGDEPFCLSKTRLDRESYQAVLEPWLSRIGIEADEDGAWVLRACVMNPFFDSRELEVDLPASFAARIAEFI